MRQPAVPSINWNPLTWVGMEKKPATVLGPEPERSIADRPAARLIAPRPKALGAKIDNN